LRATRGQQHVLLHRQVGEDAHVFGHVGNVQPGDLRRVQPRDVAVAEGMRPCEACHRPMMVRSVVVLPAPLRPSSMVSCPAARQVHAVQDVVCADVRVHAERRFQPLNSRTQRAQKQRCSEEKS
jgi:hypothetical protein